MKYQSPAAIIDFSFHCNQNDLLDIYSTFFAKGQCYKSIQSIIFVMDAHPNWHLQPKSLHTSPVVSYLYFTMHKIHIASQNGDENYKTFMNSQLSNPPKQALRFLTCSSHVFTNPVYKFFSWFFFLLSNQVEFYDRDENRKKCHYFVKLIIFLFLQIPIIFSSLNYNCSNL